MATITVPSPNIRNNVIHTIVKYAFEESELTRTFTINVIVELWEGRFNKFAEYAIPAITVTPADTQTHMVEHDQQHTPRAFQTQVRTRWTLKEITVDSEAKQA